MNIHIGQEVEAVFCPNVKVWDIVHCTCCENNFALITEINESRKYIKLRFVGDLQRAKQMQRTYTPDTLISDTTITGENDFSFRREDEVPMIAFTVERKKSCKHSSKTRTGDTPA